MANLLIVDDNAVACRALEGLLGRGNHRAHVVTTVEAAWRTLREGVVFDLVVLEIAIAGEAGMTLLQRIRDDWFWKNLPVVVYTSRSEARLVKRALALRVQNYLIKPYADALVQAEIGKALSQPWRAHHFEDAKSFSRLMGLTTETLARMRRELMAAFDEATQVFPDWAERRQNAEAFARIAALAAQAEAAGVWAGVNYLRELQEQAKLDNWNPFVRAAEPLAFASRLIFCQLNPSYLPECLQSEGARAEAREAGERDRWKGADVERTGPMLDPRALEAQIKALGNCPVIDTAAAGFQMAADGRASTLTQVMDLVAEDPGLAVQILVAANQGRTEEMAAIEDVRAGAGLLGEMKLHALSRSLPLAFERHAHEPPFTWPGFWMFQVATGRLAQFVCSYLELEYLSGTAGTAGLIHDVGKLFLLRLHPFAAQATLRYAREHRCPLAVAERKYMDCTTRDLARVFADLGVLPRPYASVLRWVEQPNQATADGDLVAIVAVARHLCLHAHVGNAGEPLGTGGVPLAATAAWRALEGQLFPSFDVKKFEVQAHAYCLNVRSELSGQTADRRPTHAQRAAELV
jgi:DNA-binding response OmpR family regulator/HD-like signal output (HDOD) protein